MNHQNLSAFIWSVADLLRGDYKQSEYGKVILPFTVLRRLDCVLEPTKAAVLVEFADKKKAGLNPEPFLLRKAGQSFYNTSPMDMRKLMGDQDHIRENLFAYQFETIHPFLDGNGRIGRLMIPLYLVDHGLLAKPSLYLSDFFERNRASYYDALMRVRVSNDLVHWVRFFLKGVAETATKGREVFRAVLSLRTEVEQSILTLGKRTPNARAALNALYRRPVLSAGDLEAELKISPPTANALIRDLTEIGVLVEVTGQKRWRSYSFDRYLRLFVS